MYSGSTIRSMQQEAAEEAARDGMVPFVYWKHDDLGPPFPFPNLGDYVPDGWERTDDFMADASGFGSPDEPALTPTQLRARIERVLEDNPNDTIGWAIIEVGQFQVVIGQFRKVFEEVPFCGCTGEELEQGRTCGQPQCPNAPALV